MTNLHTRWMIRRDINEVITIDVLKNAGQIPLFDHLDPIFDLLKAQNCIGMVCEQGEDVVGFMVYHLKKKHLLLTRLQSVVPGGYDDMLTKLKSKVSNHRRASIVCVVPDTDVEVHLALSRNGFYGRCEGKQYRFVYTASVLQEA